jgi:hypothetical protein
MRMSIALPIVAAFAAAAIGLSSPTLVHAKPKKTGGDTCKAELEACLDHCRPYSDGEFKRSCQNRCFAAARQCPVDGGTQGRTGGGGVKVGGGKTGGVLTGNTGGGKPNPKAPVLGGSTGTNGGASPFLRRSNVPTSSR